MKEYLYDAFISYRHNEFDKAVARKLQKLLENYRPVNNIKYKNTNKIKRIFRDETELPTSGDLGADIKKALEQSAFLIVICSEETAKSPWCKQEIAYFKEINGGKNDRILTLLISGNPAVVFPDELRFEERTVNAKDCTTVVKVEVEPLAANISCENQKSSLKKLKTEFLRIAAPILGCGYDDLFRRHYRRVMRRRIITLSIVASVIVIIGGFAFFTITTINNQKFLALQEKNLHLLNIAENLIKQGNKTLATSVVLDAVESNKNPSDYFKQETERLLSKSTYVPKYTEYALLPHDDGINDSVFSSDGMSLFTATADGMVTMWDVQNGQRAKQYKNEEEALKLCVYKNNLYVITKTRQIVIWNIDTGKKIDNIFIDSKDISIVNDVMIYDNKIYIIEELNEFSVIVVDLNTKKSGYLNTSSEDNIKDRRETYSRCYFDKALGAVITVNINNNIVCSRKYLRSGKIESFTLSEKIKDLMQDCIYDKSSGNVVLMMQGKEPYDIEIAVMDFSQKLLSHVSIPYDVDHTEQVMYLQYMKCSDLSEDGKLLAVGDHYGNIMVVDLKNEKLINHMKSPKAKVGSLKFLDNEHLFVSHYQFDSTSYIWSFTNSERELIFNLSNTNNCQYYCYVSPDKSSAVLTSKLGIAYLLSLKNPTIEKDIILDKRKYDALFFNKSEAEKLEDENQVCAVSADSKYKLVEKFPPKDKEKDANELLMIYQIVNIETKEVLFNAKIPANFVAIDIKDTEKGTLLTSNGYIYEFNLKTGQVFKKAKIDFYSENGCTGTANFYVDYEKKRAFISDLYHDIIRGAVQKCIVISTENYQTLYDLSDIFEYNCVACDNAVEKAYRNLDWYQGEYNASSSVYEINIPSYSRLLEVSRTQVKGRSILPFERELYGIH